MQCPGAMKQPRLVEGSVEKKAKKKRLSHCMLPVELEVELDFWGLSDTLCR